MGSTSCRAGHRRGPSVASASVVIFYCPSSVLIKEVWGLRGIKTAASKTISI